MAEIVVIDYGAGNVYSVLRSLEAVSQKDKIILSDNQNEILNASHIVLPGVGAFGACFQALKAKTKTIDALQKAVREQGKPFLGICVGHQLLAQRGLEYGESSGLGWVQGECAPLANTQDLPLPHIGWNNLKEVSTHELFNPMAEQDVYFVNSFALRDVPPEYIAAQCFYGENFCAALHCDNVIGTQFHPEKSQQVGLSFLHRFIRWKI